MSAPTVITIVHEPDVVDTPDPLPCPNFVDGRPGGAAAVGAQDAGLVDEPPGRDPDRETRASAGPLSAGGHRRLDRAAYDVPAARRTRVRSGPAVRPSISLGNTRERAERRLRRLFCPYGQWLYTLLND